MRGDGTTIDQWTPDLTANKRDILAYLTKEATYEVACAGLPLDEDSGTSFCPWGPYVTPTMLDAWRKELHGLVAELATVEGWTDEHHANVGHFIEHQPALATLRDDIAYFKERLSDARRGGTRADASRSDWLVEQRYCAGCDGECIGTSKRCTLRR